MTAIAILRTISDVSFVPEADVASCLVGDATRAVDAADHVRNGRNRVDRSDVDLLSYLDRVVDLDAKMANGTLDF